MPEIVADTHVHLYKCHDLGALLTEASRNLGALAPGAERVLFLTEAEGDDFFSAIKTGSIVVPGVKVYPASDDRVVKLCLADTSELYLIAGQQIASSENLEVLALGLQQKITQRLPLHELIRELRELQAVPVLNWAFGKWTGKRAGIVRDLLEHGKVGELVVGDSALRANFFPGSLFFTLARKRGFNVLAGTDPLKFSGEEKRVGQYGIKLSASDSVASSLHVLLEAILKSSASPVIVGDRLNLGSALYRQLRLRIP